MSLLAYTSLAVLAYLLLRWLNKRQRRLPLPPGPKGYPTIGNLFDMPTSFVGHHFDLKDTDIIYLNVTGTPTIILNSFEASFELMEKRSNIYASRPKLPMLELMGWDRDFLMMEYGKDWKMHRKLFVQEFPQAETGKHDSPIITGNRTLLANILNDPENYREHIRNMVGSIIISITYGIDTKPQSDPHLENAEKALDAFLEAVNPGQFTVNAIPWLKYLPDWFPGAAFKRQAKEWKSLYQKMANVPFKVTKDNISKAQALKSGTRKDIVKETAASMYEAGTDTAHTGLMSFILAMLCFPEYQVKAQQEIDRVVGSERLPDLGDKDSLPYCNAIMREVSRWLPVASLIIRYIYYEDEYRGYRIPKNSTILSNAWAISHDEDTYPSPEQFNPERWIKDDKLDTDMRDTTAIFGFGRRICPRRFVANSMMFLTIVTILAAFDIGKSDGEDEPKVEYTSAIQNRPVPFKCKIKPRSEVHARLVREGYEDLE
ncbi:cytochrome p450 [Moniliophthora roreri MCA 2997]|uniref:Cytochrome p450 n=1 Tax=Moniliophthora roreri (strain MCA 2997) TaxID=1381753 RepID=V2WQE2_MONRO|nr:cytochrome p450 [Moniliophthora roreri MCA 2997]